MNNEENTADRAIEKAKQALAAGDQRAARHWAEQAASLDGALDEPWLILAGVSSPRAGLVYLEQAYKIRPERGEAVRKCLRQTLDRAVKQAAAAHANTGNSERKMLTSAPRLAAAAAGDPAADSAAGASPYCASHSAKAGGVSRGLFRLWPVLAVLMVCITAAVVGVFPPAFVSGPGSAAAAQITPVQEMPSETLTFTPFPAVTNTATPLPTATSTPVPTATEALIRPSDPNRTHKAIVVSISEQEVYAYEGEELVYRFEASTGRNDLTLPGNYHVLSKIPNAFSNPWGFWMPYWMGIYYAGPNLQNGFHSLPVLWNGQTIWGDEIGTPITYGCVVLQPDEMKQLYDWAEIGTTIEIMR